jgi:hypothetical protein
MERVEPCRKEEKLCTKDGNLSVDMKNLKPGKQRMYFFCNDVHRFYV